MRIFILKRKISHKMEHSLLFQERKSNSFKITNHGKANADPAACRWQGILPEGIGLDAYAGDWVVTEVAHLLKRTLFGVRVADFRHFLSLTVDQAVDELLMTTPVPVTVPLNHYSSDGYVDPTGVASWDTWHRQGPWFPVQRG
jgi:hypothetical protein